MAFLIDGYLRTSLCPAFNSTPRYLDDLLNIDTPYFEHRGSYMSAHVLSLFRNEFNKVNNTRARMLDSIYHMTNTLKSHFWRKNVMILSSCTQRCYGRHNVSRKSINH